MAAVTATAATGGVMVEGPTIQTTTLEVALEREGRTEQEDPHQHHPLTRSLNKAEDRISVSASVTSDTRQRPDTLSFIRVASLCLSLSARVVC